MQKALVKKKLIYFTKTIPKFSKSELKREKKNENQTQISHHSLTQEKQQKKGQINNKTVLFSEYKYY